MDFSRSAGTTDRHAPVEADQAIHRMPCQSREMLTIHPFRHTRLKEANAPEVLTANGKAEVVVQDAASYQPMPDRLRHMETIAAIH